MLRQRDRLLHQLVLVLVLSNCLSSCHATFLRRNKPVRPDQSVIECDYVRLEKQFDDQSSISIDRCITNDNLVYDLPKEGSYGKSGESHLRIPGASLQHTDDGRDVVHFEASKLLATPQQDDTHQRRLSSVRQGNHTVAVIRISAPDSVMEYSAQQLSEFVFGNGISMASQYSHCSFGKLNMLPADGHPSILGGVIQLMLPMNIAGRVPEALENIMIALLNQQFGSSIVNSWDHIMFAFPPGTYGNWIAYGYMSSKRSAFNHHWATYLSTLVHELAHNLRLMHSGHEGDVYGDKTGYLGYSYPQVGGPQMCFNGHKNSLLGWYDDRKLHVGPQQHAWTGTLAAFVDYPVTNSDEYVLIQIDNDLFVQYNRARDFNADTQEMRNAITITQAPYEFSISNLMGYVSLYSNPFTIPNYKNSNQDLIIEICDQSFLWQNSRLDYYRISIHMSSQTSGCQPPQEIVVAGSVAVPVDSAETSEPPTQVPSEAPSESMAPSLAPSESSEPSQAPSESLAPTVSAAPSEDSSQVPSQAPSVASQEPTLLHIMEMPPSAEPTMEHIMTEPPSAEPTTKSYWDRNVDEACDDDATERFYVEAIGQYRRCPWLAVQPAFRRILCVPGHAAYELCSETCGRCTDSCHDTPTEQDGEFEVDGQLRNCLWLSLRPNFIERECVPGKEAFAKCQETCDNCSA